MWPADRPVRRRPSIPPYAGDHEPGHGGRGSCRSKEKGHQEQPRQVLQQEGEGQFFFISLTKIIEIRIEVVSIENDKTPNFEKRV